MVLGWKISPFLTILWGQSYDLRNKSSCSRKSGRRWTLPGDPLTHIHQLGRKWSNRSRERSLLLHSSMKILDEQPWLCMLHQVFQGAQTLRPNLWSLIPLIRWEAAWSTLSLSSPCFLHWQHLFKLILWLQCVCRRTFWYDLKYQTSQLSNRRQRYFARMLRPTR